MLRLVLVWFIGLLGIINCKLQPEDNVFPLSTNVAKNRPYSSLHSIALPCRNFPVCLLADKVKDGFKGSFTPYSSTGEHAPERRSFQARSYYNGYGAPAAPAYYPTFDPISVLASLAFLAFLLQSFTSIYDRSRSNIPSILSSRQMSPEFTISGIAKRVLRALNEYEELNDNLLESERNNAELS